MLRILNLFVVFFGATGSRMQTRHLPPWLLSGPDGGKCPSVVNASMARATSPDSRAHEIYQSCWLHRPLHAESDTGRGCAQLARLWHLAVHYHPATSAESFCNSLRDLIPDPVPDQKDDLHRTVRANVSQQHKAQVQDLKSSDHGGKAASVKRQQTLQEKLEESRQKLHQPYVPGQQAVTQDKSPVQQHAQSSLHVQSSSMQELRNNCIASVRRTLRGLAGDSPLADIAGGNLGEAAKAECQRLHPQSPPKTCSHFSAALVAAAEQGPPVDAHVLCDRLLGDHHVSATKMPVKTAAGSLNTSKTAQTSMSASSIAPITAVVLPAKALTDLPAKVPSELPPIREIPLEDVEERKQPVVKAPVATTTAAATTPLASNAVRILGAAAAPLRALSRASSQLITEFKHLITGTSNNHTASLLTSKVALAKVEPHKALREKSTSISSQHEGTSKARSEHEAPYKATAASTSTTTTKSAVSTKASAINTSKATTGFWDNINKMQDSMLKDVKSRNGFNHRAPTTSSSTNALGNSSADAGAESFLEGFVSRYERSGTAQKSTVRSRDDVASSDPAATFLSSFVSRYQEGATRSTTPLKRRAHVAKAASPEESFVQSFLQRW